MAGNDRAEADAGPGRRSATRRGVLAGGLSAAAIAGAGSAFGQAPSAKPAFIDVHHHALLDFWFAAAKEGVRAQQLGGRLGPQWEGWTPEKSLASMDRNNVAMAVLSITAPGIWFGDLQAARALTRRCNDRMAEIVRARPDRFGLSAHLSLPDVDGSLAEIAHAYDVLNTDAIGLMTNYDSKYLGDESFAPVMEELNRRKAVVVVHPTTAHCCVPDLPAVGPSTIEFLHDTNRAILNLMLTGTMHRHPDIKFVFSHTGGSLAQMLMRVAGVVANSPEASAKVPGGVLEAYKRLYFDIANDANRGSLNALMAFAPTTQIVFGTDHPIVPTEATVNGLNSLGFSREDYARIAQGNALKLFPQFAGRMSGRRAGAHDQPGPIAGLGG